jgi:CO/xanthine dehydrogenase Mo-binding subunit
MSLLGKSPPRPDGLDKVTGRAIFADDERVQSLWYGATVRSSHARAQIEAISFDTTAAPTGSVCVTAADLPGPNCVRLIEDDWPILAKSQTHHHGEPVALVAAPSRLAALQAREAVNVEYRPLPGVFDLEAAAVEYPLLSELELVCGEPEQALRQAEIVVEGTYSSGHQEHIYIECQAMTAGFDVNGRLEVSGTMQCPYYVHGSLCHALGMPADQVRVRATAVGGGFGGKEDYPSMLAIHAALLARECGHPVRIVYDRHEDIVGTTKRHPAVVRHRTAVDSDGLIQAMDIDVVLDGGAYTTLSPVVLSRAVLHAAGPYRCANVRVRGKVVKTNTATNGAFRGFGAPQSQFGIERQMDRIGRKVGLDPYEIRRRNVLRVGDRLPTGQVLDESTSALDCLERVAERADFRRRWREAESSRNGDANGRLRSGLGLSLCMHGAGFTGNGERKMRSPVTARLDSSGRIEILTSMVDMGQGYVSIFPQMALEATGLGEGDVVLADIDTDLVPDSGPTVASRTTMVVGACMTRTASEVCDRVLSWWRSETGGAEDLSLEDGAVQSSGGKRQPFRDIARMYRERVGELEVTLRHEPPESQEFDEGTYQGSAYPAYSWGANVVEVEVDRDTLEVHPRNVVSVCEVGRVIHETQCRGQIEGGTLQAIGWALMEEIKVDEGRYLNDRLATYIIPTFKDSPRIDVEMLENPSSAGPFGAKGVGELPMDGPAAAAVGAVENAIGRSVESIPATPERLLTAPQLEGPSS